MRAAIFREPGDPARVLTVQEVASPEPAAGEVLVDVDASVIQPADLMFIRGNYRIRPTLPQVAGLEGTGIIVATGAGVAITLGTRVAFRHPGAWAERVVVPAERCYVVPDGVAIDTAAQFSLNPVTAWALLDELTIVPGDWIAVSAPRSALARLVAAIAERRGQRVLGLSRRGNQQALSFPTIDAADDHLVSRILDRTRGDALAGFLDSVGGRLVSAALPALRTGATIVSYGVLDNEPIPVRNSDLIYRNLTWKGFGIDHWLATATDRRASMTNELWALIRERTIELPVASRHMLDHIQVALAAATTTSPGAKVVIRI
jgi:NADPH:quinone reductase-like Zn-dependent oxidoreductase